MATYVEPSCKAEVISTALKNLADTMDTGSEPWCKNNPMTTGRQMESIMMDVTNKLDSIKLNHPIVEKYTTTLKYPIVYKVDKEYVESGHRISQLHSRITKETEDMVPRETDVERIKRQAIDRAEFYARWKKMNEPGGELYDPLDYDDMSN